MLGIDSGYAFGYYESCSTACELFLCGGEQLDVGTLQAEAALYGDDIHTLPVTGGLGLFGLGLGGTLGVILILVAIGILLVRYAPRRS